MLLGAAIAAQMLQMPRLQQGFPYPPYGTNRYPLTAVEWTSASCLFCTLIAHCPLCSLLPLCPADSRFVPSYLQNRYLILHLKSTRRNKHSASCFADLFCVKMYLGREDSLTCFGRLIHAWEQPVPGEAGWNSLWMYLQRYSLLNLFAL